MTVVAPKLHQLSRPGDSYHLLGYNTTKIICIKGTLICDDCYAMSVCLQVYVVITSQSQSSQLMDIK